MAADDADLVVSLARKYKGASGGDKGDDGDGPDDSAEERGEDRMTKVQESAIGDLATAFGMKPEDVDVEAAMGALKDFVQSCMKSYGKARG